MVDSNPDPATASARVQVSDPDHDDEALEIEPDGGASADVTNRLDDPVAAPVVDRCASCGTAIGPREYRISRVIEDGDATLETHYCSDACFPDERRRRTDRSEADGPRDWSYCR